MVCMIAGLMLNHNPDLRPEANEILQLPWIQASRIYCPLHLKATGSKKITVVILCLMGRLG
jgi:hypothetical protein